MPRVRWTQSECRPRKLNDTREEQIRTPWRPEREASSSVTHFLTAVNFDKTMLNENQVTTVAAHNLAGGICFPSRAQAESGKADTAQCLTAVINTKLRLHAPELFLPPERRMTVGRETLLSVWLLGRHDFLSYPLNVSKQFHGYCLLDFSKADKIDSQLFSAAFFCQWHFCKQEF